MITVGYVLIQGACIMSSMSQVHVCHASTGERAVQAVEQDIRVPNMREGMRKQARETPYVRLHALIISDIFIEVGAIVTVH